MISTINISLPSKLKLAGDKLVKEGYFASFSDLVRTSLRYYLEVKHDIRVEKKIPKIKDEVD